MIAVVPVRAGQIPLGGVEAIAEARGSVVLAGDGTERAAQSLADDAPMVARRIIQAELGSYAPARWARRLVPVLEAEDVVMLPAVPDGRDLAPRIASSLGRPLLAGAHEITPAGATVLRWGGLQLVQLAVEGPFVATLLPGVRSIDAEPARLSGPDRDSCEQPDAADETSPKPGPGPAIEEPEQAEDASVETDAESLELLAPDPAAVDLAEAAKIIAGGAGLGGEEEFACLARVADALGASVGATRVVTDAGLLSHDRQIGTTGATVSPRLYVAFGISGAAQHVGGLGEPLHVISVNLDASCPMMAMADLAIVSDAAATLACLAKRLGGDDG